VAEALRFLIFSQGSLLISLQCAKRKERKAAKNTIALWGNQTSRLMLVWFPQIDKIRNRLSAEKADNYLFGFCQNSNHILAKE